MDLRGTLKIQDKFHDDAIFADEEDSIFHLKVFQTGLPQSEEETFVGTLLIFANGETKLVEHRSQD